MKNYIFWQHNRAYIIIKYLNRPLYSKCMVFEQRLHPNYFAISFNEIHDTHALPSDQTIPLMLYLSPNLHINVTQRDNLSSIYIN